VVNQIPRVSPVVFVGVSLGPLKKKGNRGTQREGVGERERRSPPAQGSILAAINQSTNLAADGVVNQIPLVRLGIVLLECP
jgi:hypothetical protein